MGTKLLTTEEKAYLESFNIENKLVKLTEEAKIPYTAYDSVTPISATNKIVTETELGDIDAILDDINGGA